MQNKTGPNGAENENRCGCPMCDDFDCPIPSDSECRSKPTETNICPHCKRPLPKGNMVCPHCTTA